MKKLISVAKDFSEGMSERNLTIFAASGCYYFFMALVPIVMIFCCILPYTPISQEMILETIRDYLSESLESVVARIISAIYNSGKGTLTLSIILTIYSASASMKALMRGIDAAYDFKRKSNIIVFYVRAFVYMLLLVIGAMLSFIVVVYGRMILEMLLNWIPNTDFFRPVFERISRLRFIVVMAFLALLFSVLFKIMPSGKVKYVEQLPGALFTAAAWIGFSAVYSWYVSYSDKFGAYGIIGTIMVAMLWIYYCLFFMLIGGYINSFMSGRKKH